MKKWVISLLFCALPAVSFAQSADGPFANVAALKAYFESPASGTSRALVSLNGDFVMDRDGFNPWWDAQYFVCYPAGDIRAHCGTIRDGDRELSRIVALFSASAEIRLDGGLYRAGAPGTDEYAEITTCPGYFNPYYKTTSFSNGFGPPFSSACY